MFGLIVLCGNPRINIVLALRNYYFFHVFETPFSDAVLFPPLKEVLKIGFENYFKRILVEFHNPKYQLDKILDTKYIM